MSDYIVDPTDPTKAIVHDTEKPRLAGSVFFRPADGSGEWEHLGFTKDAFDTEVEQ